MTSRGGCYRVENGSPQLSCSVFLSTKPYVRAEAPDLHRLRRVTQRNVRIETAAQLVN